MGIKRTRKCHKCKYTLKSKNFVTLKNGNPVCDIHKKGIPEEIFFGGKTCKSFELANKYNISDMIGNLFKKMNDNNEKKVLTTNSKHKNSKVISINKNIN